MNLSPKQLKIFQAALLLFARNGYATTTTLQIAQKAKVSEGTLFKKFGNKKQLLNEIISPLAFQILPISIKKLLTGYQITLNNFVLLFISDRLNFFKKNILPIQILTREVLYNQLTVVNFFEKIPVSQLQELDEFFQKLKEKNQIVNWPNRDIIKVLFNGLFEYVIVHYILLEERKWDELSELKRIVSFTTKGLAPGNN